MTGADRQKSQGLLGPSHLLYDPAHLGVDGAVHVGNDAQHASNGGIDEFQIAHCGLVLGAQLLQQD